ncbi:transmembrane protein 254 isoform X3 [Microtus oregoni]|uniref:transmembrane protein 254 isoform X3 n=1 Tax=Microtus oregoni TaxID=111838 RepID=UPI001BB1E76D|nr:transmembrane protein 254 isoform X3 [Microtus oregoni]
MMVAKSEVRRDAATYFRAARPWPSLITALGLGYFAWVVFWPQSVPYQSLGPLGPFTKYLVDHHHTLLRNGYWLACLIHVGESIYAMVLCNTQLQPYFISGNPPGTQTETTNPSHCAPCVTFSM